MELETKDQRSYYTYYTPRSYYIYYKPSLKEQQWECRLQDYWILQFSHIIVWIRLINLFYFCDMYT